MLNKNDEYYRYTRVELVEMLPSVPKRVLEVGCAEGATLEYLKKRGAEYVAGVEINHDACERAKLKGIDLVLNSDVENDVLPFRGNEFDCIILADVLEHLYNPWDTLTKISGYLNESGHILLSIPNVKHYMILKDLVFKDQWEYENAGILDDSHIRFFTLKETLKLLDKAGLGVVNIKYITSSGSKFRLINKLCFNKFITFTTMQYYILAQKTDPAYGNHAAKDAQVI